MSKVNLRETKRQARHKRVRKKVRGSKERPRLVVFRSLKHIYAQIIDDDTGATLTSASTLDKEVKCKVKCGGNVAAAKLVGEVIADRAIANGIGQAVFDRGGYKYHGRVKAVADAAREKGLNF